MARPNPRVAGSAADLLARLQAAAAAQEDALRREDAAEALRLSAVRRDLVGELSRRFEAGELAGVDPRALREARGAALRALRLGRRFRRRAGAEAGLLVAQQGALASYRKRLPRGSQWLDRRG